MKEQQPEAMPSTYEIKQGLTCNYHETGSLGLPQRLVYASEAPFPNGLQKNKDHVIQGQLRLGSHCCDLRMLAYNWSQPIDLTNNFTE